MLFDRLLWTGHSGFLIRGKKTISIDPFELPPSVGDEADVVLITHAHFDHCSKKDIARIAGKGARIIASHDCETGLESEIVGPGFKTEMDGIRIETVPAYNRKRERLQFHPRSNNWMGYKITMEGETLYHAGDTDFIEEMEGMSPDIALLPMGGTYTMDTGEAIEAADSVGARITVPMHYRHLLGREGSPEAERAFLKEVRGARIMDEMGEPNYSRF